MYWKYEYIFFYLSGTKIALIWKLIAAENVLEYIFC